MEELEEGEVDPQKAKQQKKGKEPKDKRTKSIDSREEATIRREQRTWSPWLELDGAPIPGMQLFGSPSVGRRLTLRRLCNSPSSCLATWMGSEPLSNQTSSCH